MRILCVDWGEKYIGLAISDESMTIAFPLKSVHCNGRKEMVDVILDEVNKNQASMIVVGLPVTLSGQEGKMAQQVLSFCSYLKKRTTHDVVLWDERMTTKIASNEGLKSHSLHRKNFREGKTRVDARAASILLQSYLDYEKNKNKKGGEQ